MNYESKFTALINFTAKAVIESFSVTAIPETALAAIKGGFRNAVDTLKEGELKVFLNDTSCAYRSVPAKKDIADLDESEREEFYRIAYGSISSTSEFDSYNEVREFLKALGYRY